MHVSCMSVVPTPLAGGPFAGDGIWGRDFMVGEGQGVLVVSPSGRGKTTLLHLIYGLRRDYSGSITMGGNDIRTLSAQAWSKLRREGVSLVFQDLRLFDALTARENIELVRSITNAASPGQVDAMAEEMGLSGHLDKPCSILSAGQRQRAAIIRGLARPFSLLLLDEPFSHLDAENARAAAAVISRRQRETGATVIASGLVPDPAFQPERVCTL
jgi:ABC-type lipoprotein export system ATPase subunit